MSTVASVKTRLHPALTQRPVLAGLPAHADDALLVRLAREGDEPAFEAIVARYREPMLRYARRTAGAGHAEDAVQQALVNAWRALRRGCEVRSLRAWLFTIVHRSALELRRGQRRDCDPLAPSVAGGRSPEEQVELDGRAQTMLNAIAELPRPERTALVNTSVHGISARDAAAELGVTEGAVRQLVFRARAHVRASTAGALAAVPIGALRAWVRRANGAVSAPSAAAGKIAAVVAIGAAVATPALVVTHAQAPHPRAAGAGPAGGQNTAAQTAGAQAARAAPGAGAARVVARPPRSGARERQALAPAPVPAAGPPSASATSPAPTTAAASAAPSTAADRSGGAARSAGVAPASSSNATVGGGATTATGAVHRLTGGSAPSASGTLGQSADEAVGAVGKTVSSALPVASGATETVTHTVETGVSAGTGVVSEAGKTVHGVVEEALAPAGGTLHKVLP